MLFRCHQLVTKDDVRENKATIRTNKCNGYERNRLLYDRSPILRYYFENFHCT